MNDNEKNVNTNSVNLNIDNSNNNSIDTNNIQSDMYASFEHHENPPVNPNLGSNPTNVGPIPQNNNVNPINNGNNTNNINSYVNNPNAQHDDHYLEEHTVLTRSSKASKVLLYGFYLLILVIGAVVFLMIRADRYEFYLVKDEVSISNGSSYQVELTPKNVRYFKYSNYDYEIADESIATVDEFGYVTAVGAGTTTLKISLSPGLTSKRMKINTENIDIDNITLMLYVDDELRSVNTINMHTNQTYTLKAIANNRNDLSINVNYSSSNTNVAIVDEYGNFTAVGVGRATITGERNGVTGSVNVSVTADSSGSSGYDDTTSSVTKVTGVSINRTSLSMKVNESEMLSATVTPSYANNTSVTWSSSNPSVAIVDNNGVVEALKTGSATITVKTADGGKTAKCQVTVQSETEARVAVTGVSLNKNEITLKVNESETLNVTVLPSHATDTTVLWSSSDTSIATVDNGKVTAKKAGDAKITATTTDGGKTAECSVKVTNATTTVSVTSVKIDTQGPIKKKVGENITLSATVKPDNASNKKVTWSSNDTSIAAVDKTTGKVTAQKAGETKIVATTEDGGKTDSIIIQVEQTQTAPDGTQFTSSNIVLSPLKLTIDRNNTKKFKIKISSAGVMLTVSSSNNNVAKVTTSSQDCNSNLECLFDAEPNKSAKTVEFEVKGIASGTAYINIKIDDAQSYDGDAITGTGKVGILVQ